MGLTGVVAMKHLEGANALDEKLVDGVHMV
jgi:hypothetical protein